MLSNPNLSKPRVAPRIFTSTSMVSNPNSSKPRLSKIFASTSMKICCERVEIKMHNNEIVVSCTNLLPITLNLQTLASSQDKVTRSLRINKTDYDTVGMEKV
ncbi:hypothetical protein PTKIN_Ptkin18bG0061600 [Pterospermum kingtungense]